MMAGQHIPVTGGCLCGNVRYESKEPPTQGYYCHCTICQRNYGGLFSVTVRFPRAAFCFTKGELKFYRASTFAKRGFCADCGSPVAFFADGVADVWIKVGSLDHPGDWPMAKDASWGQSAHWHTDTKIPWYEISDGLPQPTTTLEALLTAGKEHVVGTS
jgi:hypothetical protein